MDVERRRQKLVVDAQRRRHAKEAQRIADRKAAMERRRAKVAKRRAAEKQRALDYANRRARR